MSNVARVMRKDLKTISHTTTVQKAANQMRDGRIGSLFVEKAGTLVGIVTETDIVRKAAADGKDLAKLTVEQIMTSPVVSIEGNRTLQDAHDMMADLGVRHLGVTEAGKVVGLVSVRDLLVYFKRVTEPKIAQD